jgi:hypothetical protein
MVKRRSGPAGPDEILDDADRAPVSRAASVTREVISGTDILHLLERPAADWAKIRATVQNAQEVLAVINSYGSIHAYFASFPDARAASADMRRRFKFLGETGLWRLLNSAVRFIDG